MELLSKKFSNQTLAQRLMSTNAATFSEPLKGMVGRNFMSIDELRYVYYFRFIHDYWCIFQYVYIHGRIEYLCIFIHRFVHLIFEYRH